MVENRKVNITAWKALAFKDRVDRVAPVHWDIDLTMICNHRCPGCFYIGLPEDGYDSGQGVYRNMKTGTILPTQLVLDAVAAMPKLGGKAITFVGGGEPTIHKDIVTIFRAVREAGMKFGLVSHFGNVYKSDFFYTLLESTWVRVSVNAGRDVTYGKMQGVKPTAFWRVLENVRTFSALGGHIGVSFLIHPDNATEIVEAARLFKEAGAKYIQFKPFISDKQEGLWSGWESTISKQLAEAMEYNAPNFQVVDQFQKRKAMLISYWKKEPCGRCWVARFNPKITADGKIYICCELAYSGRGVLGDLNQKSLEEIIQSEEWPKVEQSINTQGCPPCWERGLNKAINDQSFFTMVPPEVTPDLEFI